MCTSLRSISYLVLQIQPLSFGHVSLGCFSPDRANPQVTHHDPIYSLVERPLPESLPTPARQILEAVSLVYETGDDRLGTNNLDLRI